MLVRALEAVPVVSGIEGFHMQIHVHVKVAYCVPLHTCTCVYAMCIGVCVERSLASERVIVEIAGW